MAMPSKRVESDRDHSSICHHYTFSLLAFIKAMPKPSQAAPGRLSWLRMVAKEGSWAGPPSDSFSFLTCHVSVLLCFLDLSLCTVPNSSSHGWRFNHSKPHWIQYMIQVWTNEQKEKLNFKCVLYHGVGKLILQWIMSPKSALHPVSSQPVGQEGNQQLLQSLVLPRWSRLVLSLGFMVFVGTFLLILPPSERFQHVKAF